MSGHAERALLERIGTLAGYGREPDDRWTKLTRQVDPSVMLADIAADRLTGPGREASEELRQRFPRGPSAIQARIPWESLAYHSARYNATRADIAGTNSAGGYLVATLNFSTAAEALMSMLVLGKLGATGVSSDGNTLALPRVTTSASPYWLATETSSITESDLVIGQISYSPHTVGGYTEISRLLALQSLPDAAGVVSNDLARRIGREIEKQALNGSGTAGQPKGLATTTGVNTASGASYALATGMSAITSTGDALTDDARPGWAANRTSASTLRQRQEFSGSSLTLWRGSLTAGQLHDFPAYSTSGVASGVAFFGNWSYMLIVDFAGGLAVESNPYDQANFQKGIIGLRCLATIDCAPVWPAGFTCVSGIT